NLFKLGCIDTGCLHACCTYTSKWSSKFSPTPGKCKRGSIPTERKCSESPIPDNCNNCGELIAPPDKITSLALTVCSLPFFLNVTPVTLFPSKFNLVTKARVCTSDRKSTRLNSSHVSISYAVFC